MTSTDTTTTGHEAPIGALVDVTILGARVVASDSYALSVTDAEGREVGVPHQMIGAAVTPSIADTLAGDVWRDRDGDLWFAVQESDGAPIELVSPGADTCWDAGDLAREYGPLRLVYRPGTAAASAPAAAVPAPREAAADRRAEIVRDLRALADYIEHTAQLKIPQYGGAGTYSWAAADVAEVRRMSRVMGTEVESKIVGDTRHWATKRQFGRMSLRISWVEDLPIAEPAPGGETP